MSSAARRSSAISSVRAQLERLELRAERARQVRHLRRASSTLRACTQRKTCRAWNARPPRGSTRLGPLLGGARERRTATGRLSSMQRPSPPPSSRRATSSGRCSLALPRPRPSRRAPRATRFSTWAKRRVNLSIVRAQGALGVDLHVPREVHEGEEHVAHLLLDRVRVAARRSARSSSPSSSATLAREPRASSQSKPTRATFSPMRCARVSAGMLRGTPPRMPRSPFSLRLELLPVAEDLVGVLGVEVAEDVRVAVHELVDDAGDDVVDGEGSPRGAPSSAWKTTWSSRSPSSSRRALRSPESMASMTSHASSSTYLRSVSKVCSRSQGHPSGASRRRMTPTRRARVVAVLQREGRHGAGRVLVEAGQRRPGGRRQRGGPRPSRGVHGLRFRHGREARLQ